MPERGRTAARIAKHSLSIAGHRTSISLEDAFWTELGAIAGRDGLSVAALVAAIDARREGANLCSAIRVYVLDRTRPSREGAGGQGHAARAVLDEGRPLMLPP